MSREAAQHSLPARQAAPGRRAARSQEVSPADCQRRDSFMTFRSAAAGVDYDGSAPGETGIAMLQPVSPVGTVDGLFLSGGGQFGLAAHAGMIRYLEDQKRGFDWGGSVRVPIVPGAVIDDLALGDP